MPLKRLDNGQYHIATLADAKQAILNAQEMKNEIKEAMEDSTEMMRGACRYLVANDKEGVKLKNGQSFKVVISHTRSWDAKKLRKLVDKETWLKLTKRVPDPEKIQMAIGTGDVDEDAIQEAFIETPKAPYLREER